MAEKRVVVMTGDRLVRLRPLIEKDKATGEEIVTKRVLGPKGATIECLDEAEYKLLTSYADVKDVRHIAPTIDEDIAKLKKENEALKEENAKLKAKLKKD